MSPDEPKNRDHTGGGEQNRRKQRSDDPTIEKDPPRDRDGRTATDRQNARDHPEGLVDDDDQAVS
jgi:hypothetical protein